MTTTTLNSRTALRLLAALALLTYAGCSGCSDAEQPAEVVAPPPIIAEGEEPEPDAEGEADDEGYVERDDLPSGAADRISETLPEGFTAVNEIPERVKDEIVLYENARILQIADDADMGVLVASVTTDTREQVMTALTAKLQEKGYQVESYPDVPNAGVLVGTKGERSLTYYIETDAEGKTRIELADLPFEE